MSALFPLDPVPAARSEGGTESLRTDHKELESLTRSVMKKVVSGERAAIARAVGELQARLLAHMDREERELLPRYALHAPQDASEIRSDHARIREVLAELDVAVDLHLVRAATLDAFLNTVQMHAMRESAGLYPWAARLGL